MILGNKNDFSEKDVSIMSKETGVEYARLTIGDKTPECVRSVSEIIF